LAEDRNPAFIDRLSENIAELFFVSCVYRVEKAGFGIRGFLMVGRFWVVIDWLVWIDRIFEVESESAKRAA